MTYLWLCGQVGHWIDGHLYFSHSKESRQVSSVWRYENKSEKPPGPAHQPPTCGTWYQLTTSAD